MLALNEVVEEHDLEAAVELQERVEQVGLRPVAAVEDPFGGILEWR